MKKFAFLLLGLVLPVAAIQAQDYGLYWKYKDYPGAISFTVPAAVIDIASLFVEEKTERRIFRKINKVRVMVFEDQKSPFTERDMQRFSRKAKRRGLEELLFVREGKTRVRILLQERRSVIRKLVVFVNEPENAVLFSIKGRFQIQDVNTLMENYGDEIKDKDDKPMLHEKLKVPVKKI